MTEDDMWGDFGESCVCVTHLRFVPCRREGPCEFSSSDDDVERVRAYQQGDSNDDGV